MQTEEAAPADKTWVGDGTPKFPFWCGCSAVDRRILAPLPPSFAWVKWTAPCPAGKEVDANICWARRKDAQGVLRVRRRRRRRAGPRPLPSLQPSRAGMPSRLPLPCTAPPHAPPSARPPPPDVRRTTLVGRTPTQN